MRNLINTLDAVILIAYIAGNEDKCQKVLNSLVDERYRHSEIGYREKHDFYSGFETLRQHNAWANPQNRELIENVATSYARTSEGRKFLCWIEQAISAYHEAAKEQDIQLIRQLRSNSSRKGQKKGTLVA